MQRSMQHVKAALALASSPDGSGTAATDAPVVVGYLAAVDRIRPVLTTPSVEVNDGGAEVYLRGDHVCLNVREASMDLDAAECAAYALLALVAEGRRAQAERTSPVSRRINARARSVSAICNGCLAEWNSSPAKSEEQMFDDIDRHVETTGHMVFEQSTTTCRIVPDGTFEHEPREKRQN